MSATDGTPAGGAISVSLPFDQMAIRTARTFVAHLLTDGGCASQLVDDGRLVAHELVANGVQHGRPDARDELLLTCRVLASHVVISVHDGGRNGEVVARPPSPTRSHGRGLAIVEALSERWSVDRSAGTRVEAWLAR